MKTIVSIIVAAAATAGLARGQAGSTYTNFLRQVQLPSNVIRDVTIPVAGEQFSPLAIDPGGARFELWTVLDDPFTVYLLDSKYVSTFTPVADIFIQTEDPYAVIPRTRADRPFIVDITVSGLVLDDPEAQDAAKSVNLLRHVQSYGEGNGENIDRSQAQLIHQVSLTDNATHRLSYAINGVPGADRAKVRGEERFSVFSLPDYQAPASQLSSFYMQVWPVADGSVTGISQGDIVRYQVPDVTLTLNDLYPDSRTYAQVYMGSPALGTTGTVIPGSALVIYDSIPHDRTLVLQEWDAVITEDGIWTLELITATPFGLDRLAYVTFEVDRTIEMKGTFTTIE